ncbi:ABC transporter ATP-binding protein [Streptomyces nodosus]|uniref:ABC transporter ATP-binding protein n=1 Tax=Streptomyces nodosus TaxID=40318 RepID=A0A0B5D7E4_9ACTN|nr:ABC transporter ATP-binding protein [Streptomyces nodosus]AJE39188.1 ABC transporter ATP-binding protein [Streptomyces nodosus]MBB4790077.1 ABC-2 type transport system ATP-binding protein [Streptomyces nodosus]QEV37789.1 ABC transporter ATP-binding protein [Streptomyces nodosus]
MTDRTEGAAAVRADGLSVRRGAKAVLQGVRVEVPAGRVCALIGPNGAGKSTFLEAAAGLLRPHRGTIRLLGEDPGSHAGRARMAFVAQDKPLYGRLTVAETLAMGRDLNPGWRPELAERMLDERIPRNVRVGSLSGGQRTRVALALALGKAADVLLLDEPLADLDPLSRHHVTAVLMADAAERGTSILMSSHVLAELEGVADEVLVLDGGLVRMSGPVDDVLADHRLLTGPAPEPAPGKRGVADVPGLVEARTRGRQATLLVRGDGTAPGGPWQSEEPSLENVLMSYLRSPQAPPWSSRPADGTASTAGTAGRTGAAA